MSYESFLKEIAPYVVVVGSFGRREEGAGSDIDCFLRSRPRQDVDLEADNETYMPEILSIIEKYHLEWSSVITGHVAVEQQPGFPRMVEISSHYRIPCKEEPFYREVEGVQMLCARDDKHCDIEQCYDGMVWDDSICDITIPNPLPVYLPPAEKNLEQGGFPMLSPKSQELLQFLQSEYINDGYMYSGSWPGQSLNDRGFNNEDIQSLVDAGLIQRRNCDAFAFELTVNERAKLIDEHNLGQAWAKKGTSLSVEINEEIAAVMKERTTKKPNMIVKTLKHKDDVDKPREMAIHTPYFIGQMLNVEYDLPRKTVSLGYAGSGTRNDKATGLFMVTDIICNLLVNPPANMLELQALSQPFLDMYPGEKTMLLFEDVVTKRVRPAQQSLDTQIAGAAARSGGRHQQEVSGKAKDADFQR